MSVVAMDISARQPSATGPDQQVAARANWAGATRPTGRRRGRATGSRPRGSTDVDDDQPLNPPATPDIDQVLLDADVTDDSFVRALYAQYSGILLSVVLRLTGGDRHWAEDVVQETLIRAWRNTDGLMQPRSRSLMPWLATVARRIVINDWRSRGARPQEVDDALLPAIAVPDDTEHTLQRVLLTEALTELSPAHRTVLVEIYLHGRTVEEVAHIVGVPSGTIKSRTFYAIRIMRAVLEKRGVTR